MPNSIDEQVFKMTFDNSQFESGVSKTTSTIEKFKEKLSFSGLKNGISNISDQINKIDFSQAEDGVDKIGLRFEALQVIAVTAIANITTKLMDMASSAIQAFAIEPTLDGFREYESQIGYVQQLKNSTGESISSINKYLDDLNRYADQTIYSFGDMTANIGKFTNAGVSLEDATKAIQGVSNVAALSGANTSQAAHAMYNFAQALSSGSVKLIDWNSIETANMGTVEFKNELIKTAVELGTLTEQEGKYVSTTTDLTGKTSEAFDATTNFRDSLSSQWMTADVLTKTLAKYTDETTELGQKAMAAAQEMKTFSQVLDVIKEAIGSGWATTFRIAIGDYTEAVALWSKVGGAISDAVDRQSDARNDLLSAWLSTGDVTLSDDSVVEGLGGRAQILETLTHIVNELGKALSVVRKVFSTVFPKTTAQDLSDISTKFHDFVTSVSFSPKSLELLGKVSRAVFTTIKAGIDTLGGFMKMIGMISGKIVGSLAPAFASGGDLLNAFLDVIISVGEGISDMIAGIPDSSAFSGLLDLIGTVVSKFAELGGGVFAKLGSSIRNVASDIADFMAKLGDMDEIFSSLEEKVGRFASKVGDAFRGIGSAIPKFLSSIASGMANLQLEDGAGILGALFSGATLVMVTKAINKLKEGFKFLDQISDMIDSFKSALDSLGDALNAFTNSVKVVALAAIAIAVGILVGALVALTMIDSGKLASALGALAATMGELIGAMTLMSLAVNKTNFGPGVMVASAAMIFMSTAILILAAAMKIISSMSLEEIGKGLLGVAGAMTILVGACIIMSKFSKPILTASAAMLVFSVALGALMVPLIIFGKMKIETLIQGFVAIAAVMALMVGSAILLGKASPLMIAASVGITLFAVALNLLIIPIAALGSMNIEYLQQGLVAFAIVIAAALGPLALLSFAMTNAPTMAVNLIALAAALVLFGVAVNLITAPIIVMSKIPFGDLAKGLLIMVAALAAIGVIGALLASAVVPILGVSAALLLIGVGVLAAGAGIALMVAAVTALIGIAGAAGSALIVFAEAIATVIPVLAAAAAQGLIVFIQTILSGITEVGASITEALPTLAEMMLQFISTLIQSICQAIVENGPVIIETLVTLIQSFLMAVQETVPMFIETVTTIGLAVIESLTELGPALIELVITLITSLIQSIADHAYEFGQAAVECITNFIEGIASALPDLIQAGWDLIISFINGLADSMESNAGALADALENLFSSAIEAGKSFLMSIDFIAEGMALAESLATSIWDRISSIPDDFRNMINDAKDRLSSVDLFSIGSDIVQGLINGIQSMAGSVGSALRKMADDGIAKFRAAFEINSPSKVMRRFGYGIVEGLCQGIDRTASNFEDSLLQPYDMAVKETTALSEALSKAMDVDIDSNPVITPVLDLTDINSKSGYISKMLSGGTYEASINASADFNGFKKVDQYAGLKKAIGSINAGTTKNYNMSVNGAVLNDDEAMRAAGLALLYELQRKAAMNVG